MLKKEFIKISFPKKVNELRKSALCLLAVISLFEMLPVKKLDVLHALKVAGSLVHKSVITNGWLLLPCLTKIFYRSY